MRRQKIQIIGKLVFQEKQSFLQLREFGKVGIIKKIDKQGKLDDKGIDGVMVGYEKECDAGTYRMWNLKTGMINITRDVRWLNLKYNEYKKRENNVKQEEESSETSSIESSSIRDKNDSESEKSSEPDEIIELKENMRQNTESVDSEKLVSEMEEKTEHQGVIMRSKRRQQQNNQLPKDVRDLVKEARNYLRETATHIYRQQH